MAGGAAIQCSCTKEHRKCSVARREAEHDDRGQQRTDEDLKNFKKKLEKIICFVLFGGAPTELGALLKSLYLSICLQYNCGTHL